MKKVLVIEDEQALREDLLEALELEGYCAVGADNGHDGILQAQEHKPHLIICDINMPILNGFGVIKALWQDTSTSHVPVIFLSARKEQETIEQGLKLGAVAYVIKPFNWNELLATIKLHIRD